MEQRHRGAWAVSITELAPFGKRAESETRSAESNLGREKVL